MQAYGAARHNRFWITEHILTAPLPSPLEILPRHYGFRDFSLDEGQLTHRCPTLTLRHAHLDMRTRSPMCGLDHPDGNVDSEIG